VTKKGDLTYVAWVTQDRDTKIRCVRMRQMRLFWALAAPALLLYLLCIVLERYATSLPNLFLQNPHFSIDIE